MKSIRPLLLIFCLAFAAGLRAQGFMRTYQMPGSAGSLILVNTAAATPDGGYVFFGTASTFTHWLVKTDPSGQVDWARQINNVSSDVQGDLYITPDGHYALGNYIDAQNFANNFLLFDAQGNQLARQDFQGFARVAMTSNGFLVSNRVNTTSYKLFRLDWQGNIVWEKTHSTSYLGFLYDMTATQDGGLCMMVSYDTIGGAYPKLIKANADGEVEWERYYQGYNLDLFGRIIQNAAGEYIFANHDFSTYHSVVFGVGANGDSLWSTSFPVAIYGLCERSGGGYAFVGEMFPSGGLNLFLTQGDPNIWDLKLFSLGVGVGRGRDARATPDGGLVLTGIIGTKGVLIKTDASGNIYPNFIAGKVVFDQNHDCQGSAAEPSLKNWTVVATETGGEEYYATSNNSGYYELNVNAGTYSLEVHPPGALWETCVLPTGIDLNTPGDTAEVNIMAQDSVLCSLLDVSVGTPFLRRCFDNQYTVSWCNGGTAPAHNAAVEVVLPPELDFISASKPVVQTGDTLYFPLGTVGFGECGQLTFKVNANCDSTVLGQTLCVEARIFPDTLCYEAQGWSGARVSVSAQCLGDTAVEFRLRNTGTAPTSANLNYIITEDLVVLMQGNFNLGPGEEQIVVREANGAMQRIETEQELGYPFLSAPSAFVEGCGVAPLSFGLVNQFDRDDADPFTDIDCRELVGSYDPNDKQGFPSGYGNQHLIEPNTDITYLIRFQNTGTDTAFTVVIRDTLSPWLDPATVRPGSSSHPFSWTLTGAGALAFRFDDIALPDSNLNEPASHGFVQLRISQRGNVPLGTVIRNRAAIFFDYNAPVMTNLTDHKVGKNFLVVSVENAPGPGLLPIRVSPNPFREQALITLPGDGPGDAVFRLLDATGRIIQENVFVGKTLHFSAETLLPGFYWFEIRETGGQLIGRGKMMRQ